MTDWMDNHERRVESVLHADPDRGIARTRRAMPCPRCQGTGREVDPATGVPGMRSCVRCDGFRQITMLRMAFTPDQARRLKVRALRFKLARQVREAQTVIERMRNFETERAAELALLRDPELVSNHHDLRRLRDDIESRCYMTDDEAREVHRLAEIARTAVEDQRRQREERERERAERERQIAAQNEERERLFEAERQRLANARHLHTQGERVTFTLTCTDHNRWGDDYTFEDGEGNHVLYSGRAAAMRPVRQGDRVRFTATVFRHTHGRAHITQASVVGIRQRRRFFVPAFTLPVTIVQRPTRLEVLNHEE